MLLLQLKNTVRRRVAGHLQEISGQTKFSAIEYMTESLSKPPVNAGEAEVDEVKKHSRR